MKIIKAYFATLVVLLLPMVANAAPILNFTGIYDVSTWTSSHATTTDISAILGTGGSVDTSGAPTTISLLEPNNNSGSEYGVLFTNTAAADGIFSFDWDYLVVDGCCSAVFTYIGSTLTPSTFGAGPFLANGDDGSQSGSFSGAILAGQVFGWGNFTNDDIFGANVLTISNFSAPGATIPVPGTLALLGLGIAGIGLIKRKKA